VQQFSAMLVGQGLEGVAFVERSQEIARAGLKTLEGQSASDRFLHVGQRRLYFSFARVCDGKSIEGFEILWMVLQVAFAGPDGRIVFAVDDVRKAVAGNLLVLLGAKAAGA